MFQNFSQAEAYILDIPRFTGKNDFAVTLDYLNYVGDISIEIPVIHVAGTNGKGSVCAYLRSVISKANKTVGMFTSPHLVSIRERFVINDEMISEEEFVEAANKNMSYMEGFRRDFGYSDYHPSYFEFLFFMSVIWFAKKKPDVLILETGLGGRLDATNTISAPKVCVITEIGFDHMEYLGDTISEIAGEKAGIIKPGAAVVCVDKPISGDIITKISKDKGCETYAVSKNDIKSLNYGKGAIDFSTCSRYYGNANFTVDSIALYQVENALVALRTLEAFMDKCPDFVLSEAVVSEGIRSMYWPGRLERIGNNIYIDGAHNEDGIRAFLESVSHISADSRSLLYSAVADKQIEKIAGLILESGLFTNIYISVLDSKRAADLERLKECFKGNDSVGVFFFEETAEAFETMLDRDESKGMCFVAGSLYLVGEVKRLIGDDKL